MISTVLMDGDGSTLTKDNELPDNLKNLILANPNINWIMATGRSLDLLKMTPIFSCLSTKLPHILDGGGKIMHLDGAVVQDNLISLEDLELFYQLLKLDYVNFLYYSPDGKKRYGYSQEQNILNRFAQNGIISTNHILEFKQWTFSIRPSKLLMNIKEVFDLGSLHYHQNDHNIDITARGADKGSAGVYLLNYLELSPENVAFVFNDNNDLPLVFRPELVAITKIKVGGLLPSVVADYMVDSPFEVANILQLVLK